MIESEAFDEVVPMPTFPVLSTAKRVLVALAVDEPIAKSVLFVSPLFAWIEKSAYGDVVAEAGLLSVCDGELGVVAWTDHHGVVDSIRDGVAERRGLRSRNIVACTEHHRSIIRCGVLRTECG